MIDPILAKIFGTKNEREVKALQPRVAAINALEPELQKLSDIDLAAKTIGFKEKLNQGAPLDDLLTEAFAVCREGRTPCAEHAPFRCAAHRWHGASSAARSRK